MTQRTTPTTTPTLTTKSNLMSKKNVELIGIAWFSNLRSNEYTTKDGIDVKELILKIEQRGCMYEFKTSDPHLKARLSADISKELLKEDVEISFHATCEINAKPTSGTRKDGSEWSGVAWSLNDPKLLTYDIL